jgi:hypothetical protein
MAAILDPLRCHAVDFGYLIDPASAQLLRSYGRHLVRSTRGYPEGCLAVATPTRIAEHVGALPYAIDPDHEDPGALLILPSYRRDSDGTLAGTWVTVQRIRLSPHDDANDLPGDAVRSSALIFSWRDFANHAPRLGLTIAGLRANPVSIREPRETRLGRPRLPVRIIDMARATDTTLERAANAIVATVVRGARLRLDARWCPSEDDFVTSYLLALERLPPDLRGHVSAVAGICSPDRAFQIVWCGEIAGLDPLGAAAGNLVRLGEQIRPFGERRFADTRIADEPRFVEEYGLVSPTFDAPEVHAHVRREVRRRCEMLGVAGVPVRSNAIQLVSEAMAPEDAARLLSDHAQSGRKAVRGSSGVFNLLAGLALTTCSLDEIASAIELCETADQPFESHHIARVQKLAGELVAAQLSASICPSPDMLSLIASRHGLARTVAREIDAGNERVVVPVRRALATMARREGGESSDLRRIAGALLPRDHRIITHWRGYRQDENCLAQTLIDAAQSPQAMEDTSARALADALIDCGKWNLVRDALAKSVSLLGRTDQGMLEDPGTQARRLRFIAALGFAMERNCGPLEGATARYAG